MNPRAGGRPARDGAVGRVSLNQEHAAAEVGVAAVGRAGRPVHPGRQGRAGDDRRKRDERRGRRRGGRLGPALGPNLVQLPPRWRRDTARLDAFLELLLVFIPGSSSFASLLLFLPLLVVSPAIKINVVSFQ